jgi:putative membrane protein
MKDEITTQSKISIEQTNRNDHMANERTFLAWIRTGIGIMVFGFVVERFSLFMKQIAFFLGQAHLSTLPNTNAALQGYSSTFGIILVAFGALIGLCSFYRYRKVQQQIDENNYQPSIVLAIILTLAVCFIGIFLAVYLIKSI